MGVFILFFRSPLSKTAFSLLSWSPFYDSAFAGHTTSAALQMIFSRFCRGGTVAIRADPLNQTDSKLREIIMEINDLPEFALDPTDQEQDRRRFQFLTACRCPLIPNFKDQAPKQL